MLKPGSAGELTSRTVGSRCEPKLWVYTKHELLNQPWFRRRCARQCKTDTERGVYPGQPSSSQTQLPWTVMVTPPPKHAQRNPMLRPHVGVSRHSLPACSLAHYGLPNMRQTPPQGPTPTRHGPQKFQPELRQDSIDKNRTTTSDHAQSAMQVHTHLYCDMCAFMAVMGIKPNNQ